MRYYGEWMKQEAYKRIGHLYPKVKVPQEQGGGEATVIAWIWARTVKCPNPACECEMPLASSFVLSKKKGKEAWVKPIIENSKIHFEVQNGKCPKEYETYKMGRGAIFKCPICGEITTDSYVKKQGINHQLGNQLMAVVADGVKGRIYLTPDESQILSAQVEMPENIPDGNMPENPRWFSPPVFGMKAYSDIYTTRQLVSLTTLCQLVNEVKEKIIGDAGHAGMDNNHIPLCEGGVDARGYAEAISVYLAFAIDKLADYLSTICIWHTTGEKMANTMRRQAIQMTWGYAEGNPFSSKSGSFGNMIDWICNVIGQLPTNKEGKVLQYNAEIDCGLRNLMISTDPPYYDNIGYADLSDFFYVWMRQSLKEIYPALFSTMMVPKAEELIATPYRHNGSTAKAKSFFENGMLCACQQMYKYAREDIPVTIYYAYKQSDTTEENEKQAVSSGWETMLSAIVKAGFSITGTWPMRTELTTALKGNVNALASSIVLVCRKRPEDAPQTTRRNLIATLRKELRPALRELQNSNIAPVDLAQSAIGPGMGVFSRYRRVLEADGTPMSVRSALQVINEEIDLYFNEQVGDLDTASRFCVDLYTQNAYNEMRYGEAEVLANAKSTSIPMLAANGVLYAKAGMVHLIERDELPETVNPEEKNIWLLTQQLTRAMAKGGIEACAQIVFSMMGSNAERAKDLAYRLYTIAEQKKWTNEGYAYNALVVAWPDIQTRAAALKLEQPEQLNLFDL